MAKSTKNYTKSEKNNEMRIIKANNTHRTFAKNMALNTVQLRKFFDHFLLPHTDPR